MEEQIHNIIMETIVDFNEENPEKKIDNSRESNTMLFGPGGALDSLGLVSLIVMIEQKLEDELDESIRIVSEKAMSQKTSPFLTVGTLTKFILILIEEGE